MQLSEKYRPRVWGDFVGNERLVGRVRKLIERDGFGSGGGDCLWLSGPSGTGKTTLARLVASALGCDEWGIEELDGDRCSVDEVRRIDDNIALGCLWSSSGWRIYIVNESHAMTARAVQAWLTLLERLPDKRLIIFTTTEKAKSDLFGNFTGALLSRCKQFEFTSQGLAPLFAARAREIAQAEGLNGKPESAYLRLVQREHNNFRAVLQTIDAGEMMD